MVNMLTNLNNGEEISSVPLFLWGNRTYKRNWHDYKAFLSKGHLMPALIIQRWTHSKPLHTRDWEPVTMTLQALSLRGKEEPVQVRFTLCLRDQRSIYVNARWMWSLHGFLSDIKLIVFHGHLDYFHHFLEVGLTQNRETTALWTFTIVDYSIILCVKTHMNKKFIEVAFRVEDLVTYDFTLHLRIHDHTTWFWRCVGTAFGHFLLSSHNFMVTALGSCVKWP